MSCTTMYRTACSFLNRAPTLLSRQGRAHPILERKLLTSRHLASISKACGPQSSEVKSINLKKRETSDIFYSHKRCFSQETESKFNTGGVQKIKEMTLQRLQSGQVQVPDQRNVTSLPPQINLDGAEYIAVDAKTISASPLSDLCSIQAVSETEQFSKICQSDEGLTDHFKSSMGLSFDDNGNLCWSNGQPVETVEPQEAVREFINFVKKYDNAVLLVYDGPPTAVQRLRYACLHFGLYEELISTCPYYIDVFHMARMSIPVRIVPSFKLQDICRELVDMDVNSQDPISRVQGMRKLFTDALLQRGFSPSTKCTDYFSAKDCYAQMVADDNIHPLVVEKLANAGLRLDHLKFLKEKGEVEFKRQLKKYNLFDRDINVLFTLV